MLSAHVKATQKYHRVISGGARTERLSPLQAHFSQQQRKILHRDLISSLFFFFFFAECEKMKMLRSPGFVLMIGSRSAGSL